MQPDKSVFSPTQEIEYLGFVINSRNMTIKLTLKKKGNKQLPQDLLGMKRIRLVVKLLGKITSSFPESKYGKLHYRDLEREKTKAVKLSKGNYKAINRLSMKAQHDIIWGTNHIHNRYGDLSPTWIIYSYYYD